MATITPEKEDQINRQVGVLFTRLLAENCAKETSEAIKTDGDTAMENAFEALGQKAFGGLTSDPAVSASSQQFVKYVDLNKVYQVMVVQPGVK
ncbi:MAG: hypothetical protein JF615_12375, partial [Asticcacaulis sp.]|nr:hypothetical protein [Asticcacaulis sp.]